MRTRRRPPSHPGSILKLHYLEPSGISVTDLAKELRLSRKTVSKILNERGAVTTDVALRGVRNRGGGLFRKPKGIGTCPRNTTTKREAQRSIRTFYEVVIIEEDYPEVNNGHILVNS